jgi:hypothetical protein
MNQKRAARSPAADYYTAGIDSQLHDPFATALVEFVMGYHNTHPRDLVANACMYMADLVEKDQTWTFNGIEAPEPPEPAAAPTVSAIDPATGIAGDPDVAIAITGTDFVDGAVVTLDGADVATTFTSTTALGATIPLTTAVADTPIAVAVRNPDGQASGSTSFAVTAPVVGRRR